ncbi:MAG: dTDP-4-amino-4,6-dideoxygalactose transaminase [Actinobacteria bacterium]|nr:dTDP-4-amino-4,6-dideoxygalactose transaminase [Actinomycetota bacterium]
MDDTSEIDTPGAVAGTDPEPIPFNRPSIVGREVELMHQAITQGHTSAEGPFSARASEILRAATGAQEVLLTTSCTAALEMSALLLDIEPGDTVVVPSFGFVTTALAFVRQGARILFCDIEADTLGLDPRHLAELMDDTVRAVVPIHYSGVGCDLDGISEVLRAWPRAELVEDNAHGLYGSYRGTPLGSRGRFSTLSFHETKNFICGEGGALLVNDPADVDRAHVVYQKGTDRTAFLLGQVDKYSWQDTGSSFGLSDVLAAYLTAQLERRDWILDRRRHVFDRYLERLGDRAEELGYQLPVVPDDRGPAYHMFHVLLPDRARRDHVLEQMHVQGVNSTFHYVPLHSSPHGRRVAARSVECPVTDDVSGRLLRLPFFNDLTDDDLDRAVDAFLRAAAGR